MIKRYWTLQNIKAWESALKKGYLEGDKDYIWDEMLPNYLWMMHEMKTKLPKYKGEYPVWLWLKKPDMRSSGHFPSMTKCVRLTVELNDKDVLVSDFDDWHSVLNDSFLSINEREWDDYCEGNSTKTKEESWQRVFDLARIRDKEWDGEHERLLQGVTGRIELCKVLKVEEFVSRKTGHA